MGTIRCPFCKSTDASCTTLGYVERIGAYGISKVGNTLLDAPILSLMYTKKDWGIRDMIPIEYVCNKCHRKFHKNKI